MPLSKLKKLYFCVNLIFFVLGISTTDPIQSWALVQKLDTNSDGKIDHREFYKQGKDLKKIEKYLTSDGKTDLCQYFDSSGKPTRVSFDVDYDGVADR